MNPRRDQPRGAETKCNKSLKVRKGSQSSRSSNGAFFLCTPTESLSQNALLHSKLDQLDKKQKNFAHCTHKHVAQSDQQPHLQGFEHYSTDSRVLHQLQDNVAALLEERSLVVIGHRHTLKGTNGRKRRSNGSRLPQSPKTSATTPASFLSDPDLRCPDPLISGQHR